MPCRRAALARLFAAAVVAAATVVSVARPAVAQDESRQLQLARQQRDQQIQSMKQMVSRFQPLAGKHVEDVLRLRLDADGFVVADPPEELKKAVAGTQRRVDVPELPGPTWVQVVPTFNRGVFGRVPVQPGKAAAPPPRVNALIFQSYFRPDADALATLHVQSQPGMFQISQSTQRGIGRYDSINLTQASDPQSGEGVGVSLNVMIQGTDGNDATHLSVSADSFAALRREYPDAVDRHVRPLLARLGQDHLFAPDARVAWQVLEAYFPPDPAVERQVRAILPRLADPEFRNRERALRELVALGRPGVSVLARMDRAGLSPEQSVLVVRSVAAYRKLPDATAERLRRDRLFLIDCLMVDDAEVRAAAAEQFKKVTGRATLAYDPRAEFAERSAAVRALREELAGRKTGAATRPATAPATAPTTAPVK